MLLSRGQACKCFMTQRTHYNLSSFHLQQGYEHASQNIQQDNIDPTGVRTRDEP